MKDRILQFLKSENKSSAQFAEEIGVQASGISHILSGRNNPSLDFVIKMLQRYNFISVDWLLFGRGPMYKEKTVATLFDEIEKTVTDSTPPPSRLEPEKSSPSSRQIAEETKTQEIFEPVRKRTPGLTRIVWFYRDNSFDEFFPSLG
jgi:transcriptional regulator with XRE-family HTH domain